MMAGKKQIIFIAFALLIVSLSVLFAVAQTNEAVKPSAAKTPQTLWGEYGIVINNTPGNAPQQNPRLIGSADGNLAMVWEDGRNGYTNIYAQKTDKAGNKLWGELGVQTCGGQSGSGNQNNPALIDDGSGGVIVVWQGYCNGNADIFAQRISAAGSLLWSTAGVTICDAPAGQFAPELVPDGSGGAIITWHDYRSGAGEDIYAQRVDPGGNVLWDKNGVPVCTAAGTQWYPKIASDGAGGAIITWTDGRISSADNNIFAQRLDPAGKPLWDKDGVPVCSAAQNQEKPVILPTEKGAIIAWQDSRLNNVDIFAQKIDLAGKPVWDKDGIAVVVAPYSQEEPQLATDNNGGAVVVWTDNREEDAAIYAQKISAGGKIEWESDGRRLAKSEGKQRGARIVKLKTLDWVVVWEDSRKGDPLLYCQKINSAGVNLWPEEGLPLAPGGRGEEKPAAAVASDGQLVVVWQDRRSGEFDLYGQKLLADGSPGWAENGVVFCNTTGSVIHQNVSMIDNGQGEIILAFEDARSGYLNIYAQKINRQGTLLWGKNAIPLARVKADQINPQLVPDGAGGAIVAWEDQRDPNFTKIYGQRISSQGKKVWEGGSLSLAKIDSRQTAPVIVSDNAGGAIVTWQDERDPLSLKDIYGQRVSGSGQLLWGKSGLPVCTENGDQADAAAISDGGGVVIAWTDYRRGERNPDIYAQRLDISGKPLWEKGGLLVCGAPDVQKAPALSKDKEGGTIIAWTDKGGGSYDIYAQRVNSEGKTLWLADGIPISQSPRTQQNPVISNQVIVWEDYRLGNWDIFANSVSLQGKLLWGDEGTPVVSLPLTQYAPRIINWKNEGTIIAWEDYRNGKQYEIFMQMLDNNGRSLWLENGFMVKSTNGARAPKLLPIPEENAFVVIWEDYTGGGKAVTGQLYSVD
ncbi:MAG: hypothetical protein PHG97_02965 [Candidatus Margulisbacteria bacterium]|nr:hypothetical protein [Candidatus Margulisiibacteriota bacterium]